MGEIKRRFVTHRHYDGDKNSLVAEMTADIIAPLEMDLKFSETFMLKNADKPTQRN
jgi:hypothetical protein